MGPLKDELMKRTSKTENFKNSFKIIDIMNFKTLWYKLNALDQIIHSILNYKLLRPVRTFGYLNKIKKAKREN